MEPGIKKSITIPNISLYRYITINNVDCMSLYTMSVFFFNTGYCVLPSTFVAQITQINIEKGNKIVRDGHSCLVWTNSTIWIGSTQENRSQPYSLRSAWEACALPCQGPLVKQLDAWHSGTFELRPPTWKLTGFPSRAQGNTAGFESTQYCVQLHNIVYNYTILCTTTQYCVESIQICVDEVHKIV
jgi:hypothetical protein